MNILGISAYYHDSAAAILQSGKIIAAAQEERFSRKKHDARFPVNAIGSCLDVGNMSLSDIDYIVFYDKPLLKFERLLETYLAHAPIGIRSFIQAMPIWLKEKLYLKTVLKNEFISLGISKSKLPPLLFTEHHQAHAASAFFPSPYKKAAVLCLDGVGEWATSSVWLGDGNKLTPQWQLDFPHSLGLLYSAFTYFTGFKVNSGEYKLMGLAPYGKPKYAQTILDNLIDLKPDGTFQLNMKYFNYPVGLTMTNNKFAKLFGGPRRAAEGILTQREMDIAASIQVVTEEIVLRIARTVKKELDVDYLCLAGGVALNCVSNGRLLREKIFKDVWIQPASGDAGGALGAAYSVWHEYLNNPREADNISDSMEGAYLGTKSTNDEIKTYLDSIEAPYEYLPDEKLLPKVAEILAQENVVGWFQGRMEFGPRALGGRSIIGDPRSPKMQSIMNLKIKYRESFRPFAPSILHERVADYFGIDQASPYMLLVDFVNSEFRLPLTDEQEKLFGIEKLNIVRSKLPAITHLDYSARIQTVHPETNPRYYNLLKEFDKLTACPILVNTSFNVRGEPLVCTPEDAYQCFMRTEMDYLVLENCIISKSEQPQGAKDEAWKQEFELD
ncbi:carbamoyltransferase family protein [Candidatus Marithrix sp. Canyon 246]|uniref:carbamoyltransferase family protein n=1 Tax=Candidatus Marithrix sp. Canyon 246 TaxID=1827136 RepID=UPI00084A09D6|nr:carbamoyltransferase [Candidatus Marithrix sp. Canyon 246]